MVDDFPMRATLLLLRARTSRLIAVACTVAMASAGLGTVFLVAPVPEASAAPAGIAMMGASTLTAQQIARWFASTKRVAAVPMTVEQLAAIYLLEGSFENVRGDIAFAQSVVETGYFGFAGSIVKPSNFNYAGMGACDSCNGGRQFPNTEIGVRAQIQHLQELRGHHVARERTPFRARARVVRADHAQPRHRRAQLRHVLREGSRADVEPDGERELGDRAELRADGARRLQQDAHVQRAPRCVSARRALGRRERGHAVPGLAPGAWSRGSRPTVPVGTSSRGPAR